MDLTAPETINAIRRKYGFTFKKGLGQNFLLSADVLEKIAAAAETDNGVLEIGPGFGTLTAVLAQHSGKVVAVELDERLNAVLAYTLAGYDNVKIINGDIMKTDINRLIADEFGTKKISVAANLPYYITTPVLTKLIESKPNVKNIVVMVQKEVAYRLCAKPSTKNYGAITLLCDYYTKPSIICDVPSSLFMPRPEVDSAVVKLEMLSAPSVAVKNEEMFFKTVKAAFSQRRKTLHNCISSFFSLTKEEAGKLLEEAYIDPRRRGETLSKEEFALLGDNIYDFLLSRGGSQRD